MRYGVVRRGAVSVLVATAVAGLAACSSSGAGQAGAGGSTVRVVASTDVWGDVVKQVVGSVPGVQITSIITDPSADPHSYESDARTALAIRNAGLIVDNGGGYDDFVDTLRKANGSSATVLNAVQISGFTAQGGELNEHVWYDFPTVGRVADRVAAALGTLDKVHAGQFTANAAHLAAELTALEATEAAIKRAHAGVGVAITEPVPLYLLTACGLVNRTPAQFSEAIEEGNDVPVAVLQRTEQLFTAKQVALLAYNEQTSSAETEQVLAAARNAKIAIVPVTETLPAGKDYLSWMRANLAAVQTALG